jgi:hypothetical protein
VCLDRPAKFTNTGCKHTVLCDFCVQRYLDVEQGVSSSIRRNCPVCRDQVWHLTSVEEVAPSTQLVYAPGVGYSKVQDLVSRTFFTPVGLFWRYYFLPGVKQVLPIKGIHYYLHTLEERGRINFQGGWEQPLSSE